MTDKLIMKIRIAGDEAYVGFEGVIDEDASFDKIKSLGMSKFIFDFNKVKMINSCGIREWIKYLQEIVTAKISYLNCPQIIIEQINMVHGFIGAQATVESFYAPYFCSKCDKGKNILLKNNEVKALKYPTKNCDECQTVLEFDAIEKQYFSFLNQGAMK